MWGAVKLSLNSTLGTDSFSPLDKMMDVHEYESFYKTMYCSTYYLRGSITSPPFIDTTAKKIIESGDFVIPKGTNTFDIILSPIVSELSDFAITAEDGYDGAECALNVFLPPRLEKIGNDAIIGSKLPLVIPKSVKEIATSAFGMLQTNQKVLVCNETGIISGEPWGHPGGSSMIEYLY